MYVHHQMNEPGVGLLAHLALYETVDMEAWGCSGASRSGFRPHLPPLTPRPPIRT
jgi:hypothetical protein